MNPAHLRVVMFVLNTVEYDRRVLREAATLAADGHDVTVIGVRTGEAHPSTEVRPEGFVIHRVPVSWRPMTAQTSLPNAAQPRTGRSTAGRTPDLVWLLRSRGRWYGWRRGALRVAPAADVYHGHDLPGLGVAAAARSVHGGRLIYDSHDLFVEAGANARRPRWVKAVVARAERRLIRQSDRLITVNRGIADRLNERYGPIPTSIVHNCVPRWTPTHADRAILRDTAGIGAGAPIVLYHGGFSANRGLGQLIHAMQTPDLREAHLVLLGYGPMEQELRRLAAAPAVAGRVHVLPPVNPEVLDRHVAGADVVAMVNQPASENEILSTPNKLFEALAAGVPVVTSDFPLRREIVLADPSGPLGTVCDPEQVGEIGRAIADVVNRPEDEREVLRARCLAAAHRRWNWEREQASLRGAYEVVAAGIAGTGAASRARPRALSERGD